jgi:hypothetical protein
VTTNKLASDAVTTAKIADASVTTPKLADGAVTSQKILDGTIETVDLKDGSVTTPKLADNAVTTIKITDGNVTTAKLADSSITTIKLAPDAVTTAKIADASVTTPKLADGAVTSQKILDGTIETVDLKDGSVTTPKLADNAVTTIKITDGNVTTPKLADNSVTTIKITDGNVTTAKLADSSVTTIKLATGAVTTAKIADGSVTTPKIADGSVTTVKLADSSVTTSKLATGAVTTAKLADGSVTAQKLADNAITASKLENSGVVAGTYGSATKVGRFTVDTKGRMTSADSVAIDFASASWVLTGNSTVDSTRDYIGSKNFAPFIVKTADIERMRLTAAGWLGLGTAAPSAKLDVNGGNILLSNSTGTAGELRMQGTGDKYVGIKAGAVTSNVTYILPVTKPTTNEMVLSSDTSGTMSWVAKKANISSRVTTDVAHAPTATDTAFKNVFVIPASSLSAGSHYEFRAQLFLTSTVAPGEMDIQFTGIQNVADTTVGLSYNYTRQGGGFNAINEESIYAAKSDQASRVKKVYVMDGHNYGSGQVYRGAIMISGHLAVKAGATQNLILQFRSSTATSGTIVVKKNSFITINQID